MNIRITRPEVEALIQLRLQSGAFEDAEDVIFFALQSSLRECAVAEPADGIEAKSIEELFAPLRGLDIEFGRNPSTGRPVEL